MPLRPLPSISVSVSHDSVVRASPRAIRVKARLFAVGIFANAALLFSIEPMFGKMVLPALGGGAMVWTTCLLFFQASLLIGYLYARLLDGMLAPRWQPIVHLALLVLAATVLPISIPAGWRPANVANPIWSLIALLSWRIGPLFVVLSAGAPLLQRWYAAAADQRDAKPYALYAVSNVGSVGALLAYPFLIEPRLALSTQTSLWAVGYAVLVLLFAVSPLSLQGNQSQSAVAKQPVRGRTPPRRRPLWVVLAAAPSSLLLGVTTHLSTDLAPVPVLWVVPLALYLLTFVAAFAENEFARRVTRVSQFLVPYAVLGVGVLVFLGGEVPGPLGYAIHCIALFVCALACHARLAATKPADDHLTSFYLWISVGGAIGGLFNAILAPALFTGVAEYPIALVVAAALSSPWQTTGRGRDLFAAASLCVGVIGLGAVVGRQPGAASLGARFAGATASLVIFSFRARPFRFALGTAALLLGGSVAFDANAHTVLRARSFYGIYRVVDDLNSGVREFYSGTTVHGSELLADRGRVPLTYYHRDGPVSSVFEFLDSRHRPLSVAVIGLGAGSMAAYARLGDSWTFYEIDPEVAAIARDTNYFHFLAAAAEKPAIILGDARLSLARATPHGLDLIAVDAFNSDAIPVHLLTREALELYRSRLSEDGMIAWHISNKYLDLRPVLGGLARDAGLAALIDADVDVRPIPGGRSPSVWVMMTLDTAATRVLAQTGHWHALAAGSPPVRWTDDFSSLASLLRTGQ